MKTFRLVINVGGVVFVDADRYESRAGRFLFYRGTSVIAEFAEASVQDLRESKTMTQRIALFGSEPSGTSSKQQAGVEESSNGYE